MRALHTDTCLRLQTVCGPQCCAYHGDLQYLNWLLRVRCSCLEAEFVGATRPLPQGMDEKQVASAAGRAASMTSHLAT